MPIKELKTKALAAYKVQSESCKGKWYQVFLEPWGRGYRARCNCPDCIYRKRKCKHIERAEWCYENGL